MNPTLQMTLGYLLIAHFCNLAGLANLIITTLKNNAVDHSYSASHVNSYFSRLNIGARASILLVTLLGLDYKFDDVAQGKVFSGGYMMAGIWLFIGLIFLMPPTEYVGIIFISFVLIGVEWVYGIKIIRNYDNFQP